VVQPEQLGQRIGVAFLLLELVNDLELAVQHALVAPREVDQQLSGEAPTPQLGLGHLVLDAEPCARFLVLLADPPEDHQPGTGGQHGGAVDG